VPAPVVPAARTSWALAASLVGAALSIAHPAFADPACPELRIERVEPGRGTLRIAVFDSAATFRNKPVYARTVPAGTTDTHREALCGVTASEFAVIVTQDVDDDGRFDTNLVGLPKEPWGASGRETFGPPSWANARVTPAGSVVVVRLR